MDTIKRWMKNGASFLEDSILLSSLRQGVVPVSYTHLDVYKRQSGGCVNPTRKLSASVHMSAPV